MGRHVINAKIEDDGFALLLTTRANGFDENLRNMITSMGGHQRAKLKMKGVSNARMLQTEELVDVDDPNIFQIKGLSVIEDQDDLVSPAVQRLEIELLLTYKSDIASLQNVIDALPALEEDKAINFMQNLVALKKIDTLETVGDFDTKDLKARIDAAISDVIEEILLDVEALAKDPNSKIDAAFIQDIKALIVETSKRNDVDIPETVLETFDTLETVVLSDTVKALSSSTLAPVIASLEAILENPDVDEATVEKIKAILEEIENPDTAQTSVEIIALLETIKADIPDEIKQEITNLQEQIIEDVATETVTALKSELTALLENPDLDEESIEKIKQAIETLENEILENDGDDQSPAEIVLLLETLKADMPEAIIEKLSNFQTAVIETETLKELAGLPNDIQTLMVNSPILSEKTIAVLNSKIQQSEIIKETIAVAIANDASPQEIINEVKNIVAITQDISDQTVIEPAVNNIANIEQDAIEADISAPEALVSENSETVIELSSHNNIEPDAKTMMDTEAVAFASPEEISSVKIDEPNLTEAEEAISVQMTPDAEYNLREVNDPVVADSITTIEPDLEKSTSVAIGLETTQPDIQSPENDILIDNAPTNDNVALANIAVNENTEIEQPAVNDVPEQDVTAEQATPIVAKATSQPGDNKPDEPKQDKAENQSNDPCADNCTCKDKFNEVAKNLEDGIISQAEFDQQIVIMAKEKYGAEIVDNMTPQDVVEKWQSDMLNENPVPDNLSKLNTEQTQIVIANVAKTVFNGDETKAKNYVEGQSQLQVIQKERDQQQMIQQQQRDEARRRVREDRKKEAITSKKTTDDFNISSCPPSHGPNCDPEKHISENIGKKLEQKKLDPQKPKKSARSRKLKIKN